jgi:hypothetical protein
MRIFFVYVYHTTHDWAYTSASEQGRVDIGMAFNCFIGRKQLILSCDWKGTRKRHSSSFGIQSRNLPLWAAMQWAKSFTWAELRCKHKQTAWPTVFSFHIFSSDSRMHFYFKHRKCTDTFLYSQTQGFRKPICLTGMTSCHIKAHTSTLFLICSNNDAIFSSCQRILKGLPYNKKHWKIYSFFRTPLRTLRRDCTSQFSKNVM